jgi:hypothetical protein
MSSPVRDTVKDSEVQKQIEASPNLISNEELAITTKRRKTANGDAVTATEVPVFTKRIEV